MLYSFNRYLLIFLLTALVSLPASDTYATNSEKFKFSHITTDEGLSLSTVTSYFRIKRIYVVWNL
jgi:hypothetical protein